MKKKIILKVVQPGIMFKLNKKSFRSPVSVDITHLKIDNIVSQMRSLGIKDYEITTSDIKNIHENVKNDKIIILESKSDDIDRLNFRINKLENMLHELIDQSCKDKKEIDREQNIKDIRSDEKMIKPEKIKIETIIIDNKKSDNTNENILTENKKIEIEELELTEYEDIPEEDNIPEKDDFIFKPKPFKYKSVVDPFEISSDIANLVKYKKNRR